MKDPDPENIDAGWDDIGPEHPTNAVQGRVGQPELDLLENGWAELEVAASAPAPQKAASARLQPVAGVKQQSAVAKPVAGVKQQSAVAKQSARPKQQSLSKRERRALERQKQAVGNKRRTDRRAQEKLERREAARKAAEVRADERQKALEVAETARVGRAAKRRKSSVRVRAKRTEEPSDAPARRERPSSQRWFSKGGGWILGVIVVITLATAWFAFGR